MGGSGRPRLASGIEVCKCFLRGAGLFGLFSFDELIEINYSTQ